MTSHPRNGPKIGGMGIGFLTIVPVYYHDFEMSDLLKK